MKKSLLSVSVLALLTATSCSKGSSDATPTTPTTSAKFMIEFPTAYLSIDSVKGSYNDADGKAVVVKLGKVSKWESPVISYAKGKTAYAQITAYGKTLSGSSFSSPLMHLVNTADNTIISAKGSSSFAGTTYTFNAEMSNQF